MFRFGKMRHQGHFANIRHCPQAGIGTPVELWGKEIKIDDVAAAAGTVGYELMCALALRVPVVTV